MMTTASTRYLAVGMLMVAALPRADLSAQEPDELVIGLIPEMNVFEQAGRFRLLVDYLSARLDRPVRLTMLSRYGNIVERVVNGEVDAAFLGSFTGALVSAQLDWIPVARPINLDGTSTYWGYVFVRQDSEISEVEQMRGLRLALVERATTAGYVFPVAWFRRQGFEDVESFFGEVQFWGSHDASIQAVVDGRADVGAAKNTILEHLQQEDPRVDSELRILATSPKVPSNGLLISPEIEPRTRHAIQQILISLSNEPEAADILEALGAEGFVPTDTESYQPVFDLSREAGIDIETYTYRNE